MTTSPLRRIVLLLVHASDALTRAGDHRGAEELLDLSLLLRAEVDRIEQGA